MPVFISHKSTDNAIAKMVRDYLAKADIKCYLDDLDPSLKTTDDITKAILDHLATCTHLLAVVSASTVQSWWVPFEIGAGTVKESRIATFQVGTADLPSYLTKWPIMKSTAQLVHFVQLYKGDREIVFQSRGEYMAKSAAVQTAADFHAKLKSAIGQR